MGIKLSFFCVHKTLCSRCVYYPVCAYARIIEISLGVHIYVVLYMYMCVVRQDTSPHRQRTFVLCICALCVNPAPCCVYLLCVHFCKGY